MATDIWKRYMIKKKWGLCEKRVLGTLVGKTNKHNHTSITFCYMYIYTEYGFDIKYGCGLLEITRWLWLCVDVYYTPQFVCVSKYISCC